MKLFKQYYTTPDQIHDAVIESDSPIKADTRFKYYLTSKQISVLIETSKLHKEKFDTVLKLNGLSGEQKKILVMLKLDDIFEIGED